MTCREEDALSEVVGEATHVMEHYRGMVGPDGFNMGETRAKLQRIVTLALELIGEDLSIDRQKSLYSLSPAIDPEDLA